MKKVNKIPIPIYFGYLEIIITKNFNKTVKKNTKYNFVKDYDFNQHGAFVKSRTDKNGNIIYGIFINPSIDLSLIAHEAIHIKNMIFSNICHSQDCINDEPEAYLVGWITKQICNFIKK